jgi:cytochrome c biogenesis protein CcdA
MAIQATVATWMGAIVDYLPVGYSFGAGMVSTVNPCGFAMLPAYLALYLGARENAFYGQSWALRGAKAVWVAAVVSAGFVFLFGAIGLAISPGGQYITQYIPWIALLIGIGLVALGAWMLTGRTLSAGIFHQIAEKIGDPRSATAKGFFLFGVAYGAVSLSCTLPIFLVVVGSAVAASGLITALIQFLSYSLGMGAVILALTLSVALFKEGLLVGRFRRFLPYVQQASAVFLILAGAYIVYYWLVKGQLFQALAQSWLETVRIDFDFCDLLGLPWA